MVNTSLGGWTLNLEFEDPHFKKWLIDEHPQYKTLQKKTENDILKALVRRKNQLIAFDTFSNFLNGAPGKPHSLEGNLKGYYGVSLTANYRLVIKPKSTDLSAESLKSCDTVILKGVEDYHGRTSNWIIP